MIFLFISGIILACAHVAPTLPAVPGPEQAAETEILAAHHVDIPQTLSRWPKGRSTTFGNVNWPVYPKLKTNCTASFRTKSIAIAFLCALTRHPRPSKVLPVRQWHILVSYLPVLIIGNSVVSGFFKKKYFWRKERQLKKFHLIINTIWEWKKTYYFSTTKAG